MISVIIGVYNYKHLKNLLPVLESIKNQDYLKEIIISDNSKTESAEISAICKKFGVKYLFNNIPSPGGNIGLARNSAAKIAMGKFLYFTDADIILYDKNYFNKLLNIINRNQKYILVQPIMYRILDGKEKLITDFVKDKKKIAFNFNKNCFYNYKNKEFFSVREKEKIILGEECVCTLKRLKEIKGRNIEKIEELIWRPNFHWGGILCKKEQFESIGGYSSDYYGWGCEDSDLIWKLEKIGKIIRLHREYPQIGVIHLEHPSKYNTSLKNNTETLLKRIKKDPKIIISQDIKNYNRQ